MKATIEINLPVQAVVELYNDKNNFKEWKKNFNSFEHVSGTPGEVGAVTKLVFKSVTMFETIISKNLPASISESYDHQRNGKTVMVHEATNQFSRINDTTTLIESEMNITKVVGFLPKLIMALMGGAAKKYAMDQLKQFKAFAEKKTEVK